MGVSDHHWIELANEIVLIVCDPDQHQDDEGFPFPKIEVGRNRIFPRFSGIRFHPISV